MQVWFFAILCFVSVVVLAVLLAQGDMTINAKRYMLWSFWSITNIAHAAVTSQNAKGYSRRDGSRGNR